MKVALVCIAKNEDNYIKEWVYYNSILGFNKIFIYQNDWRTDFNFFCLEKIEFDGPAAQIVAYNHFLSNYSKDFDWVAFFDVDEFLVLKKHNNIREFLNFYNDLDCLCINWIVFGDNNLKNVVDGNYSLLSRFTKRSVKVSREVKSIINLKKVKNFKMLVHYPQKVSCFDPKRNMVNGPFNHKGDNEIAQLNHYFCKTKEEFEEKINRGRADAIKIKRRHKDFDFYNKNQVKDLNAINFYNKNINKLKVF